MRPGSTTTSTACSSSSWRDRNAARSISFSVSAASSSGMRLTMMPECLLGGKRRTLAKSLSPVTRTALCAWAYSKTFSSEAPLRPTSRTSSAWYPAWRKTRAVERGRSSSIKDFGITQRREILAQTRIAPQMPGQPVHPPKLPHIRLQPLLAACHRRLLQPAHAPAHEFLESLAYRNEFVGLRRSEERFQ